jgi:hypothetical protein
MSEASSVQPASVANASKTQGKAGRLQAALRRRFAGEKPTDSPALIATRPRLVVLTIEV